MSCKVSALSYDRGLVVTGTDLLEKICDGQHAELSGKR